MSALTKEANGAACIICGAVNASVVLAHYSGIRQHRFGKGRGVKGDDRYAAPLCGDDHANSPFAEGYIPPGFEHESREVQRMIVSEEQLFYILQWRDIREAS